MENRWVTQTTFYDPTDPLNPKKGNCTEAAVASILNIPLEDVPIFHDPNGESSRFWKNFRDFFKSRGFYVHMLAGEWHIDCIYLGSGPAERGCNHMVVMKDGEVLFDPHPSRAGLLRVETCWLLVPVDPAAER